MPPIVVVVVLVTMVWGSGSGLLAAWVPTVAAMAATIVEVSLIGEHTVWGSQL